MSGTPFAQIAFKQNFGPQFYIDGATSKFRISVVSTDAGNLVSAGSDGGAFVNQAGVQGKQLTYTFGYDSSAKKLTLYEVNNGVATAKSTVDPNVFDIAVNGGSLTNGVLTLQESNGGQTVSIDLNAFLQNLTTANTNAIKLQGGGHAGDPVTATLTIDPKTSNLMKVGVNGALVDSLDVLAFLNASSAITHTLAVNVATGNLESLVGASKATIAIVEVQDVNGAHMGYMLA